MGLFPYFAHSSPVSFTLGFFALFGLLGFDPAVAPFSYPSSTGASTCPVTSPRSSVMACPQALPAGNLEVIRSSSSHIAISAGHPIHLINSRSTTLQPLVLRRRSSTISGTYTEWLARGQGETLVTSLKAFLSSDTWKTRCTE